MKWCFPTGIIKNKAVFLGIFKEIVCVGGKSFIFVCLKRISGYLLVSLRKRDLILQSFKKRCFFFFLQISLGSENTEAADGFIKVGKVLGKGNSSGEVIVVKDRVTEKEVAYKTVSIC